MPTTVPELIDIETLANRLGDSVRHVRRLVAERRIPYLKVGHFVRFDPEEIATWLNAQRVGVEGRSPVETAKGCELTPSPDVWLCLSRARKRTARWLRLLSTMWSRLGPSGCSR
jgi:excisionase family DNA binding protein